MLSQNKTDQARSAIGGVAAKSVKELGDSGGNDGGYAHGGERGGARAEEPGRGRAFVLHALGVEVHSDPRYALSFEFVHLLLIEGSIRWIRRRM
ncbi:hypothetical protein UFOVP555_43 [uncultured Caudovirales phage]|uniref:Uncharacterized protein n=1 Tax=uncultured Caudovirales phage TaxID=2100421 RepID=A0A6J5MXS9_9CAUD|nr:hypothetical protein UFOVP555_43 [uncultured Caudovirales phage]